MSKAIEILPGHPLFHAKSLERGIFRNQPQAGPTFNTYADPLQYRYTLAQPSASIPGTGFAYLDTSVIPIYEKPGDTTTALKGFQFKSHGVFFELKLPEKPGYAPSLLVTTLTSSSNTTATYYMTREDRVFALECIRQEMDKSDPRHLAALNIFENQCPNTSSRNEKLKIETPRPGKHILTVIRNDRTYSVEISDTTTPNFKIDGNSPNKNSIRSMGKPEVKFAIDAIVYDMPRDKSVFFSPHIQRMREFYWDMDSLPSASASGTSASSRAVRLGG